MWQSRFDGQVPRPAPIYRPGNASPGLDVPPFLLGVALFAVGVLSRSGLSDVLTTTGDLAIATSDGVVGRLAKGADGALLTTARATAAVLWQLPADIHVPASLGLQGVADAIAELNAAGAPGVIQCGRGNFTGSAQLLLNTATVPIIIRGQGAGVSGGGTTFTWTGGASAVVSFGTLAKQCALVGVKIDNTGTATHAVLIDGGQEPRLVGVVVSAPTVNFSVAAISIAPTTACVMPMLDRVYLRQNNVNMLVGVIGAHMTAYKCRFLYATTMNVQLGTAAATVQNSNWDGCTFEQITAGISPVVVFRVRGAHFAKCYFEHRSGAWAIDIATSPVVASNITVMDGEITEPGNSATSAFGLNFASLDITVSGNYVSGYTGTSTLFANTSCLSFTADRNRFNTAGMTVTDSWTHGGGRANVYTTGRDGMHLGAAAMMQLLLSATASIDAPNLANGAQQTLGTVTVTGASVLDAVDVTCSQNLAGSRVWGEVTSANTVTLFQSNLTGGAVNLALANYYVIVRKHAG